eukprot:gene39742-52447_t
MGGVISDQKAVVQVLVKKATPRNLSQNLEIVGARINENYSLGIKSTHYGPMGEALLWALK